MNATAEMYLKFEKIMNFSDFVVDLKRSSNCFGRYRSVNSSKTADFKTVPTAKSRVDVLLHNVF